MFTKNSINDIQMLARSPSKVDFTELRSLNWSDSLKVSNPACNRANTNFTLRYLSLADENVKTQGQKSFVFVPLTALVKEFTWVERKRSNK